MITEEQIKVLKDLATFKINQAGEYKAGFDDFKSLIATEVPTLLAYVPVVYLTTIRDRFIFPLTIEDLDYIRGVKNRQNVNWKRYGF